MHIQELNLKNFKVYNDLQIDFRIENSDEVSKMNIFIGDNGSGKSAILEAISKSLSWMPAKIHSLNRNTSFLIDYDEIKNHESSARIEISVSDFLAQFEIDNEADEYDIDSAQESIDKYLKKNMNGSENIDEFNFVKRDKLSWTTVRTRLGSNKEYVADYKKLNDLGYDVRKYLNKSKLYSLPAIMYYGAERGFINSSRKLYRPSLEPIREYEESLNGKSNFRNFFSWFEELENIENQKFREFHENNLDSKLNGSEVFKEDSRLRAVRKAVFTFLEEFSEIKIDRESNERFKVVKSGEIFTFNQLSQGEKNMVSLIGDIARTLSVMNPFEREPLSSSAIVLIDEIDLHLHPTWQISIVQNLQNIFPNCQFFITTHSPLVLSNLKEGKIFRVAKGKSLEEDNVPYGQDTNSILRSFMQAPIRDKRISNLVDSFNKYIEDGSLKEANNISVQLLKMIRRESLLGTEIATRLEVAQILSDNYDNKNY